MAKVHSLAAEKTSLLPSAGDQLPIQEGDSTDKEHDLYNVSSMDPCTDLLDTLFTSLYTAVVG